MRIKFVIESDESNKYEHPNYFKFKNYWKFLFTRIGNKGDYEIHIQLCEIKFNYSSFDGLLLITFVVFGIGFYAEVLLNRKAYEKNIVPVLKFQEDRRNLKELPLAYIISKEEVKVNNALEELRQMFNIPHDEFEEVYKVLEPMVEKYKQKYIDEYNKKVNERLSQKDS